MDMQVRIKSVSDTVELYRSQLYRTEVSSRAHDFFDATATTELIDRDDAPIAEICALEFPFFSLSTITADVGLVHIPFFHPSSPPEVPSAIRPGMTGKN